MFNTYFAFATALIPIIVGFIWYNNLVFGKTWFKEAGMTEEKVKSGNMLLILGLSYVLGLMLSMAMMSWSIHQVATQSLFVTQAGFDTQTGQFYEFFQNFMNQYGTLHRSFGHGAVHGAFAGITIALPLVAINAMFERRGWKYIAIHTGYWIVTLVLMCGTLCALV